MSILSTICNKVADWYRGTYVPPFENDPNSSIVFIGTGFYIQPPLARAIGAVAGFYLRHWQWVWSTIIGIIGVYVAVLALK